MKKLSCTGEKICFFYLLAALIITFDVNAQDKTRYDKFVQHYVTTQNFMGTVIVARDNDILYSKGFGSANLEWNIPNTPNTKFRLGSITKQFTAASILLLEERGKLKIDDPIKKYLLDVPAAWDNITIFNLLTHTSGIPNFTGFPEYQKEKFTAHTPKQIVDIFRDRPLDFAPGEKMSYSNSGYILLGYLLEKVSGETYKSFLQKNIFDTLGMKDSGYDSNSAVIPRRASGYSPGPAGLLNSEYTDMTIPFSAGALYSTTEDLLRWEQGLFSGKLLSKESLSKMVTPYKNNYALGVGIRNIKGHKAIMHGGGIEGFNTQLACYPDDKLTVVVLSNVNGTTPDQLTDKLAAIALGEDAVLPAEKKEITIPVEILSQYAGTYTLQPRFDLVITLEGNQLITQATGQGKIPVFAESETKFFVKVVEASIEFFRDKKGTVSHLILYQNGNELVARRSGYVKEPGPVDGTWTGTVDGPDGKPIEVTYVFEGIGKALLGTMNTSMGGGPFSEGKIDGNKISFIVRVDQATTIETAGILSGDVIKMTQKKGDEVKQFTVKRVSK
ncbi:MAG: serine hydrolase [Deltaproteobacteria bacterium]|nr:serine hydrolase [Deltaproteobacteria bacterium]